MKNPKMMKGPKGMGSFFPFIFVISKITEIIAPNIKDKKIVRNMFFIPKIKPKEPIKVTSPPPIPPLDTKIIKTNSNEDKTRPPILFNKSGYLLYNMNVNSL